VIWRSNRTLETGGRGRAGFCAAVLAAALAVLAAAPAFAATACMSADRAVPGRDAVTVVWSRHGLVGGVPFSDIEGDTAFTFMGYQLWRSTTPATPASFEAVRTFDRMDTVDVASPTYWPFRPGDSFRTHTDPVANDCQQYYYAVTAFDGSPDTAFAGCAASESLLVAIPTDGWELSGIAWNDREITITWNSSRPDGLSDADTSVFKGCVVWRSSTGEPGSFTALQRYHRTDAVDSSSSYWPFPSSGTRSFTDDTVFNGFPYHYAVTFYSTTLALDLAAPDSSFLARAALGPCGGTGSLSLKAYPSSPAVAGVTPVPKVQVFPNPFNERWLDRVAPDFFEGGQRRIYFQNLPASATVRIFAVDGGLVRVLRHQDSASDDLFWDLKNGDGEDAASGVYLFHAQGTGLDQTGKFVVIR
jgi:hypothetical protein